MQQLAAVRVAVVEDAVPAEPPRRVLVEAEPGDQVGVVVVGDPQRGGAEPVEGGGGAEDVVGAAYSVPSWVSPSTER
ncbi:hypothetical protein ABGB07_18615 [Micromonosporaceae bacterium B7E4]